MMVLKQKLELVRKVMKDFNFHFMDVTKVQLINLTFMCFKIRLKKKAHFKQNDNEFEKKNEENERMLFLV